MVVDTPGCQGEGDSPWRQLIVPLGTNLADYWLWGGGDTGGGRWCDPYLFELPVSSYITGG